MTGGWFSGPNGARFWAPYAALAAGSFLIGTVNATSVLMEHARAGHNLDGWEPFCWEGSSFVALMILAPAVAWAARKLPIPGERWPLSVLAHVAATLPFSLAHVAIMVGLRKLTYAAVGDFYDFSHGALGVELLYEWRKDVLSYAIYVGVFWLAGFLADRRASGPSAEPARIEIKDGTKRVLLAPADILWVEAAGNYVEVHTEAKTHLVRGALSAYEARLAAHGFARVHRSRLVNRARIRAIETTASGDLTLTLEGGAQIAASRRFRAALDAKATERAV